MPDDIVMTWPKSRPLESYLDELQKAQHQGLEINYRVHRLPAWRDGFISHGVLGWSFGTIHPKSYMVHDGAVRGWLKILYCAWRRHGEVQGWPEGFYIVRDPKWHPIDSIPMRGFQGWRWFDKLSS